MSSNQPTPPVPFVDRTPAQVQSRFLDELVRVNRIHWLSGAITDGGLYLWREFDLEQGGLPGLASALSLPQEGFASPEEFVDWIHANEKYGWLVSVSSPVFFLMDYEDIDDPPMEWRWDMPHDLYVYGETMGGAMTEAFATMTQHHADDKAEQIQRVKRHVTVVQGTEGR